MTHDPILIVNCICGERLTTVRRSNLDETKKKLSCPKHPERKAFTIVSIKDRNR